MNYPLTVEQKATLFDELADRAWLKYLQAEFPDYNMDLEDATRARRALEPLMLATVHAILECRHDKD